jgi:hypothetical protein
VIRPHYYIERDGEPVPVDLIEWAAWFAAPGNRRVANTRIGGVHISTVFLGLDHSFGRGPPVRAEALAGHARLVDLVHPLRFIPARAQELAVLIFWSPLNAAWRAWRRVRAGIRSFNNQRTR